VHGQAAVESAQRITAALFDGALSSLTEEDLEQLRMDGMSYSEVSPGDGLVSVLADAQLAPSRGQARKLVSGNGVRLNGEVNNDPEATLDFTDALHGRYYLLRRGKKNWHLLLRKDV